MTGEIVDRNMAYEKKLWRRIVSCWIMNTKGEILLQKRSANKLANPNIWSKAGGQVDSGEDAKDAIRREVKEEIGIDIPEEQIEILEIFKSKNPNNKYFSYNFLFVVDYKIGDYIFYKWDEEIFYREMERLKEKRKVIIKD